MEDLVPEVVLEGARVVAIIGQLEAAGVPKHVRMDGERHLGCFAQPCHEMMEAHGADRPATLANEYVGFRRVLPP